MNDLASAQRCKHCGYTREEHDDPSEFVPQELPTSNQRLECITLPNNSVVIDGTAYDHLAQVAQENVNLRARLSCATAELAWAEECGRKRDAGETKEAPFTDCIFGGAPPQGFVSWNDWAETPPYRGVEIHAQKATGYRIIRDRPGTGWAYVFGSEYPTEGFSTFEAADAAARTAQKTSACNCGKPASTPDEHWKHAESCPALPRTKAQP